MELTIAIATYNRKEQLRKTLEGQKRSRFAMHLKKLIRTSVLKTLIMNGHYFGVGGVLHPYILCSRNVKIRKLKGAVRIENPTRGCVELGFSDTGIADPKTNKLIWENSGEIVFKGKASFAFGDKISCHGKLTFGDHFVSNVNSVIVCNKEITFGEGCLLSWECMFIDTDYHGIYNMNELETKMNSDEAIQIGKHVWFGCRTTVLKGTEIADDCIVAAGAVIRKKHTEQNAIVGETGVLRKGVVWRS